MDYISIGGLVLGTGAGFWYASRPQHSGKLALSFSLLPFAAAAGAYVF